MLSETKVLDRNLSVGYCSDLLQMLSASDSRRFSFRNAVREDDNLMQAVLFAAFIPHKEFP